MISRRRLVALLGWGGLAGASGLARATLAGATTTDLAAVPELPAPPPVPAPETPTQVVEHVEALTAPVVDPLFCPLGAVRWMDPATWPSGSVPGAEDRVVVDRHIWLDADVRVASVTVASGGVLEFSPATPVLLESSGNVVVQGALVMRPAIATVTHTLRFVQVDEARFVGGGMEVLDSDVGLWVTDHGMLDAVGADKTSWTRSASALSAGATLVPLLDVVSGWLPGDEVVVVPTLPPTAADHWRAYDPAVIAAAVGNSATLTTPLAHEHPMPLGLGAEVLNLTRNVRIEGTPQRRAHVTFLHTHAAQTLRNIAIRHMGPRQDSGETYQQRGTRVPLTVGVMGRYGLHFHLCQEGSSGSVVEGVVVRDAGTHAFVAHESHGVVFRNCIAHATMDDAYWWDVRAHTRDEHPASDAVRYERCVASQVTVDPPFRGYRLSGFALPQGQGNACVDCVAVGIAGNGSAAGFSWVEGSDGVWEFTGCVAHNNRVHGLFTWQNSSNRHVVDRFTCYHNGGAGVSHGAYRNRYLYRDGVLYGNAAGGVLLHATSLRNGQLEFAGVVVDGAGLAADGVVTAKHNLEAQAPTRFTRCTFRGQQRAAVTLAYEGNNGVSRSDAIDLVDCAIDGNAFWVGNDVLRDSAVRVQEGGAAYVVRPRRAAGTLVPSWNARQTTIPVFSS